MTDREHLRSLIDAASAVADQQGNFPAAVILDALLIALIERREGELCRCVDAALRGTGCAPCAQMIEPSVN